MLKTHSMKKPRTFAQRWNPTALRRILRDFTNSDAGHLCYASPTFLELWKDFKPEIKALAAKAALPDCEVNEDSGNVLFYAPEHLSYEEWIPLRRPTRIAFLKHEINRLTKKQA